MALGTNGRTLAEINTHYLSQLPIVSELSVIIIQMFENRVINITFILCEETTSLSLSLSENFEKSLQEIKLS